MKDNSTSPSVSTIEDDPMEEFISMHAYILEVECVMNLVNGTWTKAAEGTLPILIAGTLTNMGMQQLRYLTSIYGKRFGLHDGLGQVYSQVKQLLLANSKVSDTTVPAVQYASSSRRFEGFGDQYGLSGLQYMHRSFFITKSISIQPS
jgi:hypothetical protein